VPIFYDVDPSDVRHQKGAFGRALKELAQNKYSRDHAAEVLLRWSHTLSKTTDFWGWDAREQGC